MTWTPDQFWEFVEGYTGAFEAGQIREILQGEGLAVVSLQDSVVVPAEALLWLTGEGPDADGKWFGETIGDGIPKLAGKYPRTYWWRSKFRSMVPNWPSVPRHERDTATGGAA
jgi:hypothetical protein